MAYLDLPTQDPLDFLFRSSAMRTPPPRFADRPGGMMSAHSHEIVTVHPGRSGSIHMVRTTLHPGSGSMASGPISGPSADASMDSSVPRGTHVPPAGVIGIDMGDLQPETAPQIPEPGGVQGFLENAAKGYLDQGAGAPSMNAYNTPLEHALEGFTSGLARGVDAARAKRDQVNTWMRDQAAARNEINVEATRDYNKNQQQLRLEGLKEDAQSAREKAKADAGYLVTAQDAKTYPELGDKVGEHIPLSQYEGLKRAAATEADRDKREADMAQRQLETNQRLDRNESVNRVTKKYDMRREQIQSRIRSLENSKDKYNNANNMPIQAKIDSLQDVYDDLGRQSAAALDSLGGNAGKFIQREAAKPVPTRGPTPAPTRGPATASASPKPNAQAAAKAFVDAGGDLATFRSHLPDFQSHGYDTDELAGEIQKAMLARTSRNRK